MVQRRRHGRSRAPRPSHFRHPRSYKVTCSGCGKEVVIPVAPPNDQELLCMECYGKAGISRRKHEQENLRSQPPIPGH